MVEFYQSFRRELLCAMRAAVIVVAAVSVLALAGRWKPPRARSRPGLRRGGAFAKITAIPRYFESNVGQTDPRVKFLSRAGRMSVFLTSDEAVLTLTGGHPPGRRRQASVVHIRPIGASPNAEVEGLDRMPTHVNYFVGDNRSQWHADITTFRRVRYSAIYPGVDLVYYGTDEALEYDLIVEPGADPRRLRFSIQGASRASIDSNGDLVLATGAGDMTMRKPLVYQEIAGRRRAIGGQYRVVTPDRKSTAITVAIGVADYDRRQTLIVDPQIVYSTYLGGKGDNKGPAPGFLNPFLGNQSASVPFGISDLAFDIALDSNGMIYLAGVAYSTNFPTNSAFQSADATTTTTSNTFVARIDPTQTGAASLVYATYLGGSGDPKSGGADGDQASGIAVDGAGDAYVTGFTYSPDFPHTVGALSTVNNQARANLNNGFVTELNPAGDGLIYSTFINGSNGAQASRIALIPGCASNCAAYVAGSTTTSNSSGVDFPTQNAYQSVNPDTHGRSAAYLLVLNGGGGALQYSTFFGGTGSTHGGEIASGIAVDGSGRAYITGATFSSDLPTQNPFQAKDRSTSTSSNAFVAEFDPTQSGANSLLYSSYLGGSGATAGGDAGTAIALDNSGHIFVAGSAFSQDFPLTANPFQSANRAFKVNGPNAFVSELDLSQSGQAQLLYSTYIGGSGVPGIAFALADAATGITVDAAGHIFIAGGTFSQDFPTTANACQQQNRAKSSNGANAFVSELDPTQQSAASQLVFSTLLGGSAVDIAGDLALDASGHVFVAGLAGSNDFPVTSGAFQTVNNAQANKSSNAFVTEIDPSSTACPSVVATPTPSPTPVPGGKLSIVPAAVAFGNVGIGATATRTLTIRNTGAGTLQGNINTLGVTAPFTVNGAGPFALHHNRKDVVTVLYAPDSATASAGVIAVISSDPNHQLTGVQVSGTGVPGKLVAPNFLRFGTVRARSSRTRVVTIANLGLGILNASVSISAGGGAFTLPSGPISFTLAHRKSRRIKVTFTPGASGPFHGTLAIMTNLASNPFPIALSGSGK